MAPSRKRKNTSDDEGEEEEVESSLTDENRSLKSNSDYNENNLKTHYFITPKTSAPSTSKRKADLQARCPLLPLFDGKEPIDNVRFRYKLYKATWTQQSDKIQTILNKANDELLDKLTNFIRVSAGTSSKLPVGYVQMTSNTANNYRILDQFYSHILDKLEECILVKLNSRNSPHIKGALKEVIKQFEEAHDELDHGGELNYDLKVISKWIKENGKANTTRVVVVIEDTSLFGKQLLNQIIKIFQSFTPEIPFKLLVALSCDTRSWISDSIQRDIRRNLDGYKFKSNDNVSLGYHILNNVFLTPEMGDKDPLLIDSTLSTIILSRFRNSNNSIDALVAELKLSYMIYFYQSPLSILIAKFNHSCLYIDGLRKLPSFKREIEIKVDEKNKEAFDLLTKDEAVFDLFKHAEHQYKAWKLAVINAVNILYNIDKQKEKFELYTSLVNGKLLNSKFFRNCLAKVNSKTSVLTENCTKTVNGASDTFLKTLQTGLMRQDAPPTTLLADYFLNPVLRQSPDAMIFNEIFLINGGIVREKFDNAPVLEENIENLMINLVRPNLRSTLEQSLENPNMYLKNESVPLICKMFKIYKEAPTAINLHDFHQAFSAILDRPAHVTDDEEWRKMSYSWFLQTCFEMMHLGFLQTKKTGEYLEKAIWKGV
ncbi:uncharacterized protein LODBEIA_P21230 [Lodderomyces beijingensis]|uniref:Origin recognition complex subunit 3 n=1 Tax=Lodderomyces beijingensis TaxID=1775926 RepID=A0ABP0ZIA3_9ASCO